jgi:diguanylate cyclase (GGDEF)-like protein/PAS domain S-box-containing protein
MWSAISETHGRLLLVMPESAGVQGPAMFEPGSMFTRHLASGEAQTVMIGSPRNAEDERLTVQRTLSPDSVALEGVLVVAVSRSLAAVQRHWFVLGWVCCVAWLLFAGVLITGLATIQRRRNAFNLLQADRARERIDHAERIELALTSASLALWDRDVPKGKHVPDATTGAMLGYSADELRRSGIYWEEMLHPDDLPAARQMLDAHLRGDSEAYEAEYRMRHKDGRWVWIHRRGKVVERSIEGAPLRMVGTRMDITERRLAEDEIQRLAFYDGLTGLPNRRLLLDRLCHAIATAARRAVHGALLFIDLDHFKDLNDTLGHDMGDRLLAEVADRLRHVTREVDTVARLGGDEFVLLIADLGESADEAARAAEAIAKKLLATLALPYRLDHHDLYSTPSIGITLFDGDAQAVDELLKQADLAMYQAKGAGRNTVRFFDPGMQASVTHSAALEGDLRHALRRREVLLHYQPVVDLQQRIVGAEALLRWRHPSRGMVSPADFIPLAEKTGLILPLGQWVLETACQQLALWAGKPDTEHLTIAVNVSARQFRQADFVSQVLAVLEQTRANPRRLKLELTESMLLNDVEDVIAKMSRLKHEGVSFALDDFGTGYSSLAYLKRLPLDQLKIDKAFVQNVSHDPNDASIARAIIALARSLNLDVVAEGVETRSQRDFLADNGCPTFQGYLFGRPGPVEDLLRGSGRGNARPGPPPSRWLPMFPGTAALST